MVLVLFWHCFMSFIIPLLLSEAVFTRSSEVYSLLPSWASRLIRVIEDRRLFYLLPILGGIFQSTGAKTLMDSVLSGILTTLFLVVLLVLWRRGIGKEYNMRSFLPSTREFKTISVTLLVYYFVTGVLLRPEEIPNLGPQVTIWLLYLFFGVLLYMGIKKSKIIESDSTSLSLNPSPKRLLILGGLLSLGSSIGFISGLNYIWALLIWLTGILFGFYVLIQTIRNII
jgi:hypothetical protein